MAKAPPSPCEKNPWPTSESCLRADQHVRIRRCGSLSKLRSYIATPRSQLLSRRPGLHHAAADSAPVLYMSTEVSKMSTAPAFSNSSRTDGAAFFWTKDETASQLCSSKGWMVGDLLPGVIASHFCRLHRS